MAEAQEVVEEVEEEAVQKSLFFIFFNGFIDYFNLGFVSASRLDIERLRFDLCLAYDFSEVGL